MHYQGILGTPQSKGARQGQSQLHPSGASPGHLGNSNNGMFLKPAVVTMTMMEPQATLSSHMPSYQQQNASRKGNVRGQVKHAQNNHELAAPPNMSSHNTHSASGTEITSAGFNQASFGPEISLPLSLASQIHGTIGQGTLAQSVAAGRPAKGHAGRYIAGGASRTSGSGRAIHKRLGDGNQGASRINPGPQPFLGTGNSDMSICKQSHQMGSMSLSASLSFVRNSLQKQVGTSDSHSRHTAGLSLSTSGRTPMQNLQFCGIQGPSQSLGNRTASLGANTISSVALGTGLAHASEKRQSIGMTGRTQLPLQLSQCLLGHINSYSSRSIDNSALIEQQAETGEAEQDTEYVAAAEESASTEHDVSRGSSASRQSAHAKRRTAAGSGVAAARAAALARVRAHLSAQAENKKQEEIAKANNGGSKLDKVPLSSIQTDDVVALMNPGWNVERKARRALRYIRGEDLDAILSKSCLRKGVSKEPGVFITVGGSTVRSCLENMSLSPFPDQDALSFDFKWATNHKEIPFTALEDGQIVNHFKEAAAELGSKIGLLRNIRSLEWFDNIPWLRLHPRTFNLSSPWELSEFFDDYVRTEARSILRIFLKDPSMFPNDIIEAAIKIAARYSGDDGDIITLQDFLSLHPEQSSDWLSSSSSTNLNSLGDSSIAQTPTKQLLQDEDHAGCASKNAAMADENSIGEAAVLNDDQSSPTDICDKKETVELDTQLNLDVIEPASSPGGTNEDSNNLSLEQRALNVLTEAEDRDHTLYTEGMKNAWVVKPGHGSRGRGVRCKSSLLDIVQYSLGRKRATIAQKYVENPLLLHGKKFDIRMWVMVTEWNPLTVWCFEPCYLRICTEDHSLEDLEDIYKHLCNRCIQQNSDKYNEAADSESDDGDADDDQHVDDVDEEEGDVGVHMWSSTEFSAFLDEKYGTERNVWQAELLPKLRQMAAQVMHSTQDAVPSRKGSFEWFGLDFLIDDKLQPWLLEVNISPDMSTATEVLQELVPAGVSDLLGMFFPEQSQDGAVEATEDPPGDSIPRWHLVFKGKSFKSEILSKRHWLKKAKLAGLRAGKAYSIRDAMMPKLGPEAYAAMINRG